VSATPPRIHAIVESFASVITPHSRIVDIGAGKGLLALEMARRFDARVTLLDVAQYNHTHLPLSVCDSRALAFCDDSFDYAVLSFVLHHSPNPDVILREALRVARQVIVAENDVRGPVRKLVTRLVDSWPAIQYGTPPCYVTQSRDEWLALFRRFPVEPCVLGEYTLESSFFRCFTVQLKRYTVPCRVPKGDEASHPIASDLR
jgi:SAM-dependent methyltransferase